MCIDSYDIFDLKRVIFRLATLAFIVGDGIRNMIRQFVTEAAATKRERERVGG